jgi:signal transduction histidine kinase
MSTDALRRRVAALTLRRRLGVGVLAILTVLISAVGVADVLVLRHALYARSADALREELRILTAAPPPPSFGAAASEPSDSCAGLSTPPVGLPPGAGRPGQGAPGPGGVAAIARALAAQSIASAIAGPDGTLISCRAAGRSGGQAGFSIPASLPARFSSDRGYLTVHAHGLHLLAVSQPIGPDRAILVADIAGDDDAVAIVLAVTVIGGLIALFAAGALSVPLLRTALAPLRTVATTADKIAGGDLDQRANLADSADEIGRLGAAFDRMVDRLQDALTERDTVVEHLRVQDEAMRRFLADAAHELRTPLTAIHGGAQVLRLGAASDPRDLNEALGHIEVQTERMSRLIEDLLTLSYQDAGRPAAPRELIDVGALVAEHASHWRNLAADHTVTVHTEPAWVLGDPDALTRACANLVENAQKYSPHHTEITLEVTRTANRVRLAVTDRGEGIPVAERDKVFHRFYRGDRARSRATGGAGLGLAIVAGVVADHGGEVRVDQAPGGGTTIVLELPAAARDGQPVA